MIIVKLRSMTGVIPVTSQGLQNVLMSGDKSVITKLIRQLFQE